MQSFKHCYKNLLRIFQVDYQSRTLYTLCPRYRLSGQLIDIVKGKQQATFQIKLLPAQ